MQMEKPIELKSIWGKVEEMMKGVTLFVGEGGRGGNQLSSIPEEGYRGKVI